MQTSLMKVGGACVLGIMSMAGVWLGGPVAVSAQQSPASPLKWDAMSKETTPNPGTPRAEFKFSVTNVSDAEVIIDRVQPSCGCTVAEMPSQPWHLAAHEHGEIPISVDLAGKVGTLAKTVTVFPENLPPETLSVIIHIPDAQELARGMNQQMAVADRQAVFKGDCAKCHVEPTHEKMGKDLYVAACGICHEAKNRATMVPDLRTLNHPTDYAYWKMMITIGTPGTLMPGFGQAAGGPLTDEQVDSLAKTLTSVFPGNARPAPLIQRVNPPNPPVPQSRK